MPLNIISSAGKTSNLPGGHRERGLLQFDRERRGRRICSCFDLPTIASRFLAISAWPIFRFSLGFIRFRATQCSSRDGSLVDVQAAGATFFAALSSTRNASFTESASGKAAATSGAMGTITTSRFNRPAYFSRTPPVMSYSRPLVPLNFVDSLVFVGIAFTPCGDRHLAWPSATHRQETASDSTHPYSPCPRSASAQTAPVTGSSVPCTSTRSQTGSGTAR